MSTTIIQTAGVTLMRIITQKIARVVLVMLKRSTRMFLQHWWVWCIGLPFIAAVAVRQILRTQVQFHGPTTQARNTKWQPPAAQGSFCKTIHSITSLSAPGVVMAEEVWLSWVRNRNRRSLNCSRIQIVILLYENPPALPEGSVYQKNLFFDRLRAESAAPVLCV